ncbi:MAG: hypothetical protein ABR866_05900 [Candidatus Korobacteraceae bacterium]
MAAEYYKLDKLAELTKQQPQTGHWSQVVTDTKYEKGLSINFGISREVVGSKRIAMGRTIIPPHTCNERHVHLYAEASMYIIRGTMVLLLGPEARKILCPPGTFVFAPEGVIHGVANASRTEEVELVFAYGGVPSKEAAGIVFVDDSENVYPPPGWDVID